MRAIASSTIAAARPAGQRPWGRSPASGKHASAEFAGTFRIEHGQIAEVRLVWDNVSLLKQLGHM